MRIPGAEDPPLFLTNDDRGQTAPIGVILILGLAIVGSIGLIVYGNAALSDSQEQSQILRAEHAMTQFDSQLSLVALGHADVRTVEFGQASGGGRYAVHPSKGTVKVIHANWDGANSDSGSPDTSLVPDAAADAADQDDDLLLAQGTFGTVSYQQGDTTIAYQGGGVWREHEGGGTTMISPPEVHYRGATLTFPIVEVIDGNSGSGDVSAKIQKQGSTSKEFPSASTYPSGATFSNPTTDGKVLIKIQSDYYQAWADYFRSRTEGDVSVDDANQEITVELFSTGFTGAFTMPGEGGSLPIQGISDHSMDEFSITLRPDNTDAAKFNNLQWSMWAEADDRQFEVHLKKGATDDISGTDCTEQWVEAKVYFSPSDGDANAEDPYHGWNSDQFNRTECIDADNDGSDDEVRLIANFVDDEDGNDGPHDDESAEGTGDDHPLTYTSLAQDDVEHFDNPNDQTLDSSPTLGGHSVSWEDQTYSTGDTETIDRLINHYFSELDDGDGFDLTVDDKGSDTVQESASSGVIDYTPGDQFITFMHITKNVVTVEFQ